MRSGRVLVASLTTSLLLLAPQWVAADSDSQKPLGPEPVVAASATSDHDGNGDRWQRGLNFSSPAPHLFASAYGLLQQLSNTVFPNGHTMAAVEIPAFTLLYHGRMDDEAAPSPEWLAFDIEMAYGIMGSTRQSWMLSYQTTRPVKALYFDGESAALMGLGQLDTQMLHLYGNITGPEGKEGGIWRGLEAEYERAMGLCDWLLERGLRGPGVPGGGIEGVIRMNAGFEVIWCDFSSESLRLVSRGNVTAPQTREIKEKKAGEQQDADEKGVTENGIVPTSVYPLPPQPTRTDRPDSPSNPPIPPNWRGAFGPLDREPFLQTQGWGWFASATWHYGSSGMGPGRGETRARVLGCGIMSWYSPDVWGAVMEEERRRLNLTREGYWTGEGVANRSAAVAELGRRRRLHHLEDVTSAQAAEVRDLTEGMLRDAVRGGGCSGMEWTGTVAEIVQRTAGQMMATEQAARFDGVDGGNVMAARNWLFRLRGQSHMFLVSFLEYPHEITRTTFDTDGPLFGETYSRCRYRYTRLLVGAALTSRERELRDAVEEVMGGVCGVLLGVGFEIERAWYALEEDGPSTAEKLEKMSRRWERAVRLLRAWVGWEGEFIRCDRVCGWDERCYIPMWPLLKPVWDGKRPPPYRGRGPWYGGNHTRPGYGMPPPRSPVWMGDETDLWQPKCIKAEDIMPRARDN